MVGTFKAPLGVSKSEDPNKGKLSNTELFFLVALASWTMLFGTFILSFTLARVKTPLWPPPFIESFPLTLPSISTLTIALSSIFLSKALTAFKSEKLGDFKFFWFLGMLTGVFFGVLQFIALKGWMTFDVRGHVYSSSVAFLILFHGIHFVFGLGGLLWKFFRPSNVQSLRLWSWFWHFLGVVWLAIFLALAL